MKFANIAAAILAVGLPLTTNILSTEARIIKAYTHESGKKEFEGSTSKGKCVKEKYPFGAVTNPVRAGRYAMKHWIADCNARAELVAGKHFKENQEYWVGWSMFFPEGYPKNTPKKKQRTIVVQSSIQGVWKLKKKDGKGLVFDCPGPVGKPHHNTSLRLNANGKDEFVLLTPRPAGGKTYLSCIKKPLALQRDTWNDIVVNFKPTANGSGFYRMWVNGQQLIDYQGPMLPKGWGMGNFKLGAYAGSAGNGEHLVYTDELKIGDASSSYKEVAPAGRTRNDSGSSGGDRLNLAQNKPVKASSEPQKEHSASNVVDGKSDTRWSAQGYSQTLEIRLADGAKRIGSIEILPYKGRAYQFKAIADDGKVIFDRSRNTKGGNTIGTRFEPVATRTVKLVFTGCHGSSCSKKDWLSIQEVRVFEAE